MEHSMKVAEQKKFVVVCDISEFYLRLSHHRLENALKHLYLKSDIPFKICEFLSNFSGTYSFGIPIGGPAGCVAADRVRNRLWACSGGGALVEVDPVRARAVRTVRLSGIPGAIAVTDSAPRS